MYSTNLLLLLLTGNSGEIECIVDLSMIAAASAVDTGRVLPTGQRCYRVVLRGGQMSHVSSNAASAARVDHTHTLSVSLLLDHCLRVHCDARFAVLIILIIALNSRRTFINRHFV